jgi:hypothetical protein
MESNLLDVFRIIVDVGHFGGVQLLAAEHRPFHSSDWKRAEDDQHC